VFVEPFLAFAILLLYISWHMHAEHCSQVLPPERANPTAALERQALCHEFASVKDYLQDLIATTLAEDEEDTVLANDGRFVPGCYAEDGNGMVRNV
jgi:hypothetical protein